VKNGSTIIFFSVWHDRCRRKWLKMIFGNSEEKRRAKEEERRIYREEYEKVYRAEREKAIREKARRDAIMRARDSSIGSMLEGIRKYAENFERNASSGFNIGFWSDPFAPPDGRRKGRKK